MPRPPKETKPATYSDRVGLRLRELRDRKRLDVEQFRASVVASHQRITGEVTTLSRETVYAWERGFRDIPMDLLPAIADVFGLTTATGWMPDR